jgi:hypothetical protein
MQQFHIYALIEVHEPVAKRNHFHHRFTKVGVEVAGLHKEAKNIAALFQVAKAVNGDNVRSNVDAALYGSLKCALDRQSSCKVIPERRQSDPPMLL